MREDELTELINEYSLFIRAHIQKFRVANFGVDSEDIAQEVKIKIWKILKNEKTITNYTSYIRRIVESSVIDHLRKYKRDEGIYLHEKAKRIAEQSHSFSSEFSDGNGSPREALARAIEKLIKSRRAVVQLYLLNMTVEEISDHYKWSQHKTRNLLYRGLADIKSFLKGNGQNEGNNSERVS